jgi:hypothetical protein
VPGFGSIESRHGVDEAGYEPPPPVADEHFTPAAAPVVEYRVSPSGVGLAFLGALALIASVFLPLDEANGLLATIQKNTLVQHDEWFLLAVGILLAAVALYSYFNNWRTWVTPALGLVAAGLVAYMAADKNLRTLVSLHGGEESQGVVVPFGIAIYVAGVGAALALIGGWIAWRTTAKIARCPDCAEEVLAEAQVCKHCGRRFA